MGKRGKPKNGEEEKALRVHCVYLLKSINPKYTNSNYIGYTTNPRNRIRQHNGEITNGAWKTKRRRPWKMVCFVYGFPTEVAGLQFEWAFQHPRASRIVKQVVDGRRFPRGTEGQLQILFEMLNLKPWCQYPLKLNWTHEEFHGEFSSNLCQIPPHMKSYIRPLNSLNFFSKRKIQEPVARNILDESDILTQPLFLSQEMFDSGRDAKCFICKKNDKRRMTKCKHCDTYMHVLCLARRECPILLPETAKCPKCRTEAVWAIFVESLCRDFGQDKDDDGTSEEEEDSQSDSSQSRSYSESPIKPPLNVSPVFTAAMRQKYKFLVNSPSQSRSPLKRKRENSPKNISPRNCAHIKDFSDLSSD